MPYDPDAPFGPPQPAEYLNPWGADSLPPWMQPTFGAQSQRPGPPEVMPPQPIGGGRGPITGPMPPIPVGGDSRPGLSLGPMPGQPWGGDARPGPPLGPMPGQPIGIRPPITGPMPPVQLGGDSRFGPPQGPMPGQTLGSLARPRMPGFRG